ncbi:MAG: beta-lactamase family protein [Lachnospiraceae bacterium]|nr:beta-lactamase family protein [Lachnospiraceae bacterium]
MIKAVFATLLTIFCLFISALTSYAMPDGDTPSGIPFDELESRIDAVAAGFIGITTPGAAVVVVNEGEIIFSKGYGYSDIENNTLVDPAVTVFDFASVGKLFVWISAMQLVEQGLLDLDADITTYLPVDFSRELKLKYAITMRDLMNHSAGFEQVSFDISFDILVPENLAGLEETLIKGRPVQIYEPGTISSYSNYGVALAAYLVGTIAGKEYVTYERENIFLAAGMTNTLSPPDYLYNPDFMKLRANPYTPAGESGFNHDLGNIKLALWPAGMTSGTAEDLARFALALTPAAGQPGPFFANPDSLKQVFTPSSLDPDNRPGTHHGFWKYQGAALAFGHAGHSYHFSNFVVMPDERFGFLAISNGLEDLNVAISNLLLGYDPNQIMVHSDDLPKASSVTGAYQLMQMRIDNNFLMPFTNYIPPRDTVTALDDNTIELKTAMFGAAVYRQTAPYIYQIISTDNPGMTLYFNILRFQMDKKMTPDGVTLGNPVTIHVGDGKDFSFAPRSPMFGISLGGFIISVIYFLIFPLVILITFIVNKKKEILRIRFDRFSDWFLISGTLIVLNNVILLVRFIGDPLLASAPLAPHIWLNYLLALTSVVLFALTIKSARDERPRKRRKILFILTAVMMLILVFILYHCKLFTLL